MKDEGIYTQNTMYPSSVEHCHKPQPWLLAEAWAAHAGALEVLSAFPSWLAGMESVLLWLCSRDSFYPRWFGDL